MFHHRTCRQHRVARPENAGHGTRPVVPPVHHRGVHLLRSGGGEDAAPSGIEQGVVFECHDSLGYRVERIPARSEDITAGRQRTAQSLVI